jgi:hypothetical protein
VAARAASCALRRGRVSGGSWWEVWGWQLHVVFVGPAWGHGKVMCLRRQQDQTCNCGSVAQLGRPAGTPHSPPTSHALASSLWVTMVSWLWWHYVKRTY